MNFTRSLTHILDSSSTCFDYISRSQPNFVTESGIHPSSHPNCHHQIVYAKFNLQIYFSPPYIREFWHYKNKNIELTKEPVEKFSWLRAFLKNSVDEKVVIFNKIVFNIFSVYSS